MTFLAEQTDVKWRFQPKVARREVQGFLNACSRIEKDRQEEVVTLALVLRVVRLGENRCELIFVQVTQGALRRSFRRNMQYLGALS